MSAPRRSKCAARVNTCSSSPAACDYPDPLPAYEEYACEPNLQNRRLNESGYCDKDYDALLKKAEGEVDLEKRKAIFKQVVAKLTDDSANTCYRFHAAIFHVPQPYKRLRHQRQRGF